MRKIFFVTGIGTGIGKTIVSAILARALDADYWKPVQAGMEERDSERVEKLLAGTNSIVFPELYTLKLPASPHIAARSEGINIDLNRILQNIPDNNRNLIIEGAGGLMVPLNSSEFVSDLIRALECRVILVSRNYLGSINHSLLTARVCRELKLPVAGWVFNDQFMDYEAEIVRWSGYPKLASIPYMDNSGTGFIEEQALLVRNKVLNFYEES